jgi:hypothetical protein
MVKFCEVSINVFYKYFHLTCRHRFVASHKLNIAIFMAYVHKLLIWFSLCQELCVT